MVETFWMFREGVDALSRQVDRARQDADAGKGHVERYCQLTVPGEGVLLDTFGSHEKAYDLVHRTLVALSERTKYVVEGIGDSVDDYRTVQDESSTRFDTIGKVLGRGSDPPSFLRHGLTFAGPAFSDVREPTEVLRDPGVGQRKPLFEFDPYSADAFNPAAWARALVKNIVGWDPFESAVRWLSGDWAAFEQVLFSWVQIGQLCERVGTNLARAALELPQVWKGREAGAAQWYLHALANATSDFSQICGTLVGYYRNAVEAAKAFNKLAANVLADIVVNAGLASAATAALAAPNPLVRKAAKGTLALLGTRLVQQANQVREGYELLNNAADAFKSGVNTVQFHAMGALVVRESLR